MESETPFNTAPLDQKPVVPPSTDVFGSQPPKINGNAHEHDPLFDETAPAPLTNGDSHAPEPRPEVTTKLAAMDAVAPSAEIASEAPMPPPLASEGLPATDPDPVPVEDPQATVSVPPPVEQPTSDVRDEISLQPAINSTSLPAENTQQAAVEAHEDAMDTQADTPVAEQEPVVASLESSAIQLAPETTPQEQVNTESASVAAPATDEAMEDAPDASVSQSSLVRPRDEAEDETEPNAKRLKLETSNGDAEFKIPEAPASAAPTDYGTPVLATSAEAFLNSKPVDDQPITKLQVKFLLDAVRKTKKTKAATFFLNPVDAVALGLPTYYQVITKPMDLTTMEQKLKEDGKFEKYQTANEVLADMDQIVKNSVQFNGPNHQVTTLGMNMRAYFIKLMQAIPTGEKAREDEVKKAPPPKPAPVRRESRAQARSPTTKTSEVQQQPFLDPNGMPLIRRDSSTTDRPKREIHRPPPRDLPYSVRPNKKHKVELKFCESILQEMLKKKYESFRSPFDFPVDPVALNIPNYFKIIKNPMDLSTIQSNLKNGSYQSAKDFYNDMKLIFQNCYKFNPNTDAVYAMGKSSEELFERLWGGKKEFMSQHRRDSEPASSDEEEGSDEDGEDDEEETAKIDASQKRMVEIQQQIAALNAEAMALAQGVQARTDEKKNKKAAKAAKSGSGKIKRQSSGAGVPKAAKEKSAKRQQKKWKKLTLEQKRQVSEGIGLLDEAHMRKAVQIIRNGVPSLRDVHDDELELDIDEIPDEVVYELWEFVKKLQPKSHGVIDEDDDYEEERGHKAAAASSHRKKNKPMTAREQESKIAQVREQLARFEGQSPIQSPTADLDDSSDDDAGSDDESSEEE